MRYGYLLVLCFLLGGCDQINKWLHNDEKEEKTEHSKIGVLISGTVNPFFSEAYNAFKAYGVAHNNVVITIDDANNNEEEQLKAFNKMIASGAQAIVINMVDSKNESQLVIDKAREAGIPIIFFNRSPGEERLLTYNKALFVDGDAVQGGVLQGLDVLEHWREHPKWDKNGDGSIDYAILMGIPGNPSAEARTKWSAATITNYPELSLPAHQIALEPAMFREKLAYDAVNKWIANGTINKIEVILANNDTMAIGAVKALEKANIDLPVFGIDAIPAALDLVKKGKLSSTVINDVDKQVKTSIIAAVNLIHNRPVTTGIKERVDYQTILIPYHILEHQKDNEEYHHGEHN